MTFLGLMLCFTPFGIERKPIRPETGSFTMMCQSEAQMTA
jgi:hypothetical protein